MTLRVRTVLAVAVATLLMPAPLTAQTTELPAAQELVNRFVSAIGGADAFRRHTSMRLTGAVEVPAMALRMELDVRQKQPNLLSMTMTLPGLGEVRSGFDGTVGWIIDPMQGARIMEGVELAQASDQAAWDAVLRSPTLVREMRTVELTQMGGQPCYRVHVIWRSGRESHDCYSSDTGLLVGSQYEQHSPMGSTRVETLISEYKEFGGVKFATRVTQNAEGQQFVVTVDNVEFGNVSDSDVAPPEAIRALTRQPD